MKSIIDLNVHLKSWREGMRDNVMTQLKGNSLIDPRPELADKLVRFDYPLDKVVELDTYDIKTPTLETFIDFVVKSYEKIYKDDPKNVWGHGLGDLFLEGIVVREDGKLDLIMGS